jgi:predicted small lipoprotein YifL
MKLLVLLMFFLTGCCCVNSGPIYLGPSGKAFPTDWGKPPEIQTKDYRPLPYGYGQGSSTLYHWIIKNKWGGRAIYE